MWSHVHCRPRTRAPPCASSGCRSHPILVPIPIACFVGVFLTDLTYWWSAGMMWADFSAWLVTVGVIVGFLAAIFGLIDFLGNRFIRAQPPAWPHAIGNVVSAHSRDPQHVRPFARRLDLGRAGASRCRPPSCSSSCSRPGWDDRSFTAAGWELPNENRPQTVVDGVRRGARADPCGPRRGSSSTFKPRSAPIRFCRTSSNICFRRCISRRSWVGKRARSLPSPRD